MNLTVDIDDFRRRLASFAPRTQARPRLLALYSGAIALADEAAMTAAVTVAKNLDIARPDLYEIVLQSYLFLGFPRMLVAAEHFHGQYKEEEKKPRSTLQPVGAEEAAEWFERGIALCRLVYADNYERLKDRVEMMAPEIFRWMVFEGYGKVLSRPGLSIVERELAIIACLMIENRPAQLFSHVRGALNIGADSDWIRLVIEDIGHSAGDGYQTAADICRRLQIDL